MKHSVDRAVLRSFLPPPPSGGGKDDRGAVLVIGGDAATVGAVRLAGEAALRVGAGKLQLVCAPEAAAVMGVAVPEALVLGSFDPARIGELAQGADAVLIGPGLADPDRAAALVKALLPLLPAVPLVLDALALAATESISAHPGPVVLTPNPTEAAFELGWAHVDDPVEAALTLAKQAGAVVALGADLSVTATPSGDAWTDASGDAGLGVSGSGDVKAGAVLGLLARGLEPERAAVLATWLHARAGERCGPIGYLARQIADELPAALAELSDSSGRDAPTSD